MKNIDAIEGILKYILTGLHQSASENLADDTEYIRTVRTILNQTDLFLKDNQEIYNDPKILIDVLYQYSRELWINKIRKVLAEEAAERGMADEIDYEYHEYYYDHIYHHGVYPK